MYIVLTLKLFYQEDGLFLTTILNAKAALGAGWPTRQPRHLISTPHFSTSCVLPCLYFQHTQGDPEQNTGGVFEPPAYSSVSPKSVSSLFIFMSPEARIVANTGYKLINQ